MMKLIRPALMSLLLFAALTGLAYPVLVTVVAQLIFPRQANGSLLLDARGNAVGSELIGQPFSNPKYFWGRLSATSPLPYNSFNPEKGTGSSGSNYGPTNPAFLEAARARIDALRKADPENSAPIPVDLVTSSASGLDPHISVAAAQFQTARVARLRQIDISKVQQLVQQNTEVRTFRVLGELRVNVLQLNLALDSLH